MNRDLVIRYHTGQRYIKEVRRENPRHNGNLSIHRRGDRVILDGLKYEVEFVDEVKEGAATVHIEVELKEILEQSHT
jgi:hypothetical protein